MVMKVYGVAPSMPTARVLACLHEKDLEYENVQVNPMFGQTKEESFLSLNPFGQIPVLEDGDLTLFESRAITQYLAHTYGDKGNQLVSQDHKELATVAVWIQVEAMKFDVVASKLCAELAIKPLLRKPTNDAVVEENKEKLVKILDVYEARLKDSKYLAGDCFTLADLHHLPSVHYLMNTKIKALFDERPHVSAWRTAILARPAWTKVAELQVQAFAAFAASKKFVVS